MSKPLYLVGVVHRGREGDFQRSRAKAPAAAALAPDQLADIGFSETVRASNRREAYVLIKRKYPDHLVLDSAVKLG